MSSLITSLSLADVGRRMSLAEFDRAECAEGVALELSRGVITMVEVPNVRHFLQVDAIRRQLYSYQGVQPDRVNYIGSGADCKILIEALDSERHPDVLVYTSPPPAEETWSIWIPELVIEVVSQSSRDRDYHEKPDEYLQFGVKEYWIIDSFERRMTVYHRSRGKWKTSTVGESSCHVTHLLPGLKFDFTMVQAAADRVPEA
jgi:Uma2 family endonuclease